MAGESVEVRARKSYEDRGGDKYVLSKLPERARQILEAGTVVVNGKTRAANQAEREAAQRVFERAIDRQYKADLDYTTGVFRPHLITISAPIGTIHALTCINASRLADSLPKPCSSRPAV